MASGFSRTKEPADFRLKAEPRKQTAVDNKGEPVGEKTRVTVVHGRFARLVDIGDHPFGWVAFVHALKGVVEE